MKLQVLLIMLFLVAGDLCFGQKNPKGSITLFEVGSKTVTVDEFVYLYQKNNQGRKEEFTKEKIDEYIELLIHFKLKVQEAEARGLDRTEEFKIELNGYKEELKKPFVAEANELKKLTEQAYDRLGQEVKASHILINMEPDASPADTLVAFNKANEIRSRAMNGENFEKLAKEFSDDPSVKMNGGNLGYFSALQMVFPFEEAAFGLDIGQISKPVRTQFGYHLIKLLDKRPSSGEVEVSHILVRGSDENAKKLIDEVYDQLQHGQNWDSVCIKYSQDPGTKNNGGRLRPFGIGALSSAPKFEEVAFSLNEPGSISKPLETSYGWHIIRLERKIPLPPFEELKTTLERKVARDERMTISLARTTERRRRKFNYAENPSLKSNLDLMADSSLTAGNWRLDKTQADENSTLFSIGNQAFTVKNFAKYIEGNSHVNNLNPREYIQNLYDQFVDEHLAALEDAQLQQANPEYKRMVQEYKEGILLFNIMEKEVWNKASEDSLGQRKYYDNHPEKYKADIRLEARIFATGDKKVREEIKTKIENGDTLSTDDLKRFKSIVNFRSYEKGESKVIDLINWTVGLHTADADGMYYLVEANKLVPPGIKGFSEARASIISDYQNFLENKWLEELKSKYTVKVNAKGRKKAIEQLIPKGKS